MDKFIEYAPILIVVVSFLIQQRFFVTPEQLERKHRHILAETDSRYAKFDAVTDLREQVFDIDEKITKLYEAVLQALKK